MSRKLMVVIAQSIIRMPLLLPPKFHSSHSLDRKTKFYRQSSCNHKSCDCCCAIHSRGINTPFIIIFPMVKGLSANGDLERVTLIGFFEGKLHEFLVSNIRFKQESVVDGKIIENETRCGRSLLKNDIVFILYEFVIS